MVTKAIVEDASDKYLVKVRIPFYDRASVAPRKVLDADLPSATVCSLPNSGLNLRKGDIVFVSFEDDDIGRPVIVGCLYTDKINNTRASILANSIDVDTDAKLPKSTSIGDVSGEELQRIKGVSDNIQGQIDTLQTEIGTLQTDVDKKSALYAHKVSFGISSYSISVYINLLTNSSTPLVVSDFVDSSNNGNPNTIDKISNIWGTRHYSGATYRGVGILMSVSYNTNAEEWRALVMNVINYDGTVDVIELQQSSLDNFSDTVTKL